MQALPVSEGFDGTLQNALDGERRGWLGGQEIGDMIKRHGAHLPQGVAMGKQQPQGGDAAATLDLRKGPG
jgi:hypothetical protein